MEETYQDTTEPTERDFSHLKHLDEETLSPEEEEKRMVAEGWVSASDFKGPPTRPVPMPPRITNVPGMYDKLDYDARHIYDHLLQSPDLGEHIHIDVTGTELALKYELLEDLGSGVTCLVKHGKDRSTSASVAVKCITATTNTVQELTSSWKHVAQYLTLCKGPTIISLIDTLVVGQDIYLILPLCAGNLVDVLRKTAMTWTQKDACRTITQILQAALIIHGKGLVHGDFTPGNILSVDNTGTSVKLTGFTKVTGEVAEGDLICEPHFKAPEVLELKKHGKAVDLWSIGCLSYLFLSGKLPFEETNLTKLNAKIKSGNFDFPEEDWGDIDPKAREFVASLLNKDALARPTAEQALQHPWILGGGSDRPIKNFHTNLINNKALQ